MRTNIRVKVTLKSVIAGLTLVLFVSLTACGGGGGGGGGGGSDVTVGSAISASGTATKGLIVGGIVKVYAPSDLTTPIHTAPEPTGDNGAFRLTIPATSSELLVIEVTAAEDGSSTMVCDADKIKGCEISGVKIAFGDKISLSSGFTLRGVVKAPAAGAPLVVHINALTDLVYEIATQTDLDVTALDQANGQVARLFDFDADVDFTSIPGVDITKPDMIDEKIVGEDRVEAYQLASISGALLQEALVSESGQSLETALDTMTTGLATNIADMDQSATASAASPILDHAHDLATDVADAGAREAAAILLGQLSRIESGQIPDMTAPTPSPGAGMVGLAQAKLFISDLRNVQSAFSQQQPDESLSPVQEIQALGKEVASAATSDALAALGRAASAVSDAVAAYNNDPSLTAHVAANGVAVGIVPGADNDNFKARFTVTDAVSDHPASGTNTVSMVAVLDGTGTRTSPGSRERGELLEFDGTLSLSGTVENTHIELSVLEGSSVEVVNAAREPRDRVDGRPQNIPEFLFRLQTRLEQTRSDSVFMGTIRVEATQVEVQEPTTGLRQYDVVFDSLSVTFNGDIKSDARTVALSLSVIWDGTGYVRPSYPLGTPFERARSYRFEDEGNVLVWTAHDFFTGDPIFIARGYLGVVEEILVLHDEVTLSPGGYFPPVGPVVTFPIRPLSAFPPGQVPGNVFEFYNSFTSYFGPPRVLVEDIGIFEPAFSGTPALALDGGQYDYMLSCIGFCQFRESYVTTGDDNFPDNPGQTIRGSFSLRASTDIIGIGDSTGVELSLSGEKLGVTLGTAGVTLTYSGRRMKTSTGNFDYSDIQTSLEGREFEITNQDGIRIALRKQMDNINGRIYRDNEEFATIEKTGSNPLMIRYSDGTFESL